MLSSMSSPIRRGSILPISATTAFKSITLGCKTCMRLKASNCRVTTRPAAQPPGDGRAVLALPPALHADEPFGMFLEDSGALARITIDIVVQTHRQQLGLRAVAQHLHQGRIDVEQFAISADSANAVRRSLHQRSVVRLRAPQRLLGPLPLGDIARHR